MAWYRIISKETHERQHVCCEPADVRRLYPMERYFLPRALDREPGEDDEFEAGALVDRPELRAHREREVTLARMTRGQREDALVARAVKTMRDELIAAGVLPAAGEQE